MSTALGAMFSMPGYVDPGTPDPATLDMHANATATASSNGNTLKLAWIIVIVSLVSLWALGWAFSK